MTHCGVRVNVSHHARRRLRERFPVLHAAPDIAVNKLMRVEVSQAIAAGNIACRLPLVFAGEGRRRVRSGPSHRYVWNDSRCYVVGPLRDDGPKGWLVVSVFRKPKTAKDPSEHAQVVLTGGNHPNGVAAA